MAFAKLIKRDSEILNRMAQHNTQVSMGITDERMEEDWYKDTELLTYEEYLQKSLEGCKFILGNCPYTQALEQFVKERI